MLHHERLRPPSHDYPADEWNVIEKAFHPELLAQLETMLALGNGYLGMRGCPEEGGPNAENGTFINGFYETCPQPRCPIQLTKYMVYHTSQTASAEDLCGR
jgi:alpha,alpha-trehalose phosphorylase